MLKKYFKRRTRRISQRVRLFKSKTNTGQNIKFQTKEEEPSKVTCSTLFLIKKYIQDLCTESDKLSNLK